MPYEVQKYIEYKGEQLKPGDILPLEKGERPKRSLVSCRTIKWKSENGEPDPLQEQPRKRKPAAPVNTKPKPRIPTVPSLMDVVSKGVPLHEAYIVVARAKAVTKIVKELGDDPREVKKLIDGMSPAEVYEIIDEKPPVFAKPEDVKRGKIDKVNDKKPDRVYAKPEPIKKGKVAKSVDGKPSVVAKPEPSIKEQIASHEKAKKDRLRKSKGTKQRARMWR